MFCASGGIGRRTRFRSWRRKVWGFESLLAHHLTAGLCVRSGWR